MSLVDITYLKTDFSLPFVMNTFTYDLSQASFYSKVSSVGDLGTTVVITTQPLTPTEQTELDNVVANYQPITYLVTYQDYIEDTTVSSTTSINYQEKLKLTTDYLEAGDYIIRWAYNWKANKNNSSFEAKIEIDDTTIIGEQAQEPFDISNGSKHTTNGFKQVNLSRGSHTIDLDYRRSSNNNSTMFIWNASLEIESITQ